jgi:hypothetical protein
MPKRSTEYPFNYARPRITCVLSTSHKLAWIPGKVSVAPLAKPSVYVPKK